MAGVSPLVGLVAAAVPAGGRVLVAKGEFTSLTWSFAAQAERGVVVTEADLTELVDRATDHDLVAVSAVASADGALADLESLAAATAGTHTRVLIDVTYAAGWLPLSLIGPMQWWADRPSWRFPARARLNYWPRRESVPALVPVPPGCPSTRYSTEEDLDRAATTLGKPTLA